MNGMNVEGNSNEGEKGKKNETKDTKQPRRGSKQRLKENEQEQQLTLARSVISNFERKVSELDNSNKILKMEISSLISSQSLNLGGRRGTTEGCILPLFFHKQQC